MSITIEQARGGVDKMSNQQSLDFDGKTYEPERDGQRLSGQLDRVKRLLLGGGAFTLQEIAERAQVPLGTVGTRIRDLRKERWGSHTIKRTYVSNGLFTYELVK